MSKNKITRWIDFQNEKICFSICTAYYRKVESGKSELYILKPRFYLKLISRFVLTFCNFWRFNPNLYEPYINVFKRFKKGETKSLIGFLKELIFVFAGLKYFVKPEYRSSFYEDSLDKAKIIFKQTSNPLISIIVPVHNQIKFTLNCIRSISLNVSDKYTYEVIIIDDCSTDDTQKFLKEIPNLIIICNKKNIGFLNSCNKGVKESKGKYICFLNNDTLILKAWLENLVNTIIADKNVGCVGSKLIYPYGLLQEAGGIIFSDASGVNYGRYHNPNKSDYNFLREVDYCSGASILFLKSDYEDIGGLDERYAPAYYEDTDFCFSVRNLLKKKVVYQPLSVLVHFEGVSSGKKADNSNVKSYQEINKRIFYKKWLSILSLNHPRQNTNLAARKYLPLKNIVVIDSYLPFYDKESGSNRIHKLLYMIKDLDYHIVFIPDNGNLVEPYYSELIGDGIEVLIRNQSKIKFSKSINSVIKNADFAWVCRPNINKKYANVILKSNAKWIYDTVDLHYVRIKRAIKLYPENKKLKKTYEKFKALEISIAKKADLTICITNVEQDELRNRDIFSTAVVPNIHTEKNECNKLFTEREGIIFIGSYNHDPNVDAVNWLCTQIMPLVWETIPDLKLTLLGNNPPPEVKELAQNRNVIVTGYIKDVSEYFESAKIFVAPLRYGAGMKGKIGQSLEFALPAITTDIGAEGMRLTHGKNILIANDAEQFATDIIGLYNNKPLWENIRKGTVAVIKPLTPEAVLATLKTIL